MRYLLIGLISFLIGLVVVYLSPTTYKTVMVYPTLDNVDKIQYKDTTGSCYRFTARLVDCKTKK